MSWTLSVLTWFNRTCRADSIARDTERGGIKPSGSSLPAFTIRAFHPVIEFRDVGDLHVRSVPFHLLPLADVLGQVAKDGEFRQPCAIVKARRGPGCARA